MSVKAKSGLHGTRRKTLLIVLLIVVLLVSSCFVYLLIVKDNNRLVHVKNEAELTKAVNNAKVNVPVVIVLDRDISLSALLTISRGQNITLTSNGNEEFFKLIGAPFETTIWVNTGGFLWLDGIIVTHPNDVNGYGLEIAMGGTCIMFDGEVSKNTSEGFNGCGGVQNQGTFELYGGIISGNTATTTGGGVQNSGVFRMYGGVISGNTAYMDGGGVCNIDGTFEMHGGEISSNSARQSGGGVYSSTFNGAFNRYGGTISGNTAKSDNDVCIISWW